jgi:hypothetical protein
MRSGAWALVGSLLLAAPAYALSVSVSVESCRGCPAAAGVEAEVTLKATGAGGDREPRSQTIRVPGTAIFEVPEGRSWEASATAAGFWSRPGIAGPGEPGALAARVELWPAGAVLGELRAAPGLALPATLTARFQPAPGASSKPPNATAACRVDAKRFRCDLPAGDLDLRLRARGFITQYRWGVKVPAHRSVDVGSIELKPGASIVGWVQVPGREKPEESRVEMGPQVAGAASSQSEEERRGWLREAKVNSRGFFELDGVPPGSYRLTVSHPRLAPAMVGPIGVRSGSETEVDPIQLHPPANLEVHLHPASDPYGSRWTARLLREGSTPGSSDQAAQSAASTEGVWRARGLSAGRYTLQVEGSHNARWAYQAIEVSDGMAPLDVDLPFVRVEGAVRLGKEPLEALIWFGGQYGSRRIAARSDPEGRFSAVLPELDEGWYVEVYNEPRHVAARFFEVAVRKSSGQPAARVRFDVPDTLVRGRVVDENDQPVAGADVLAYGGAGALDRGKARSSSGARGGEPGSFEIRGLRPGTWQFVADVADGDLGMSSDALPVEVAADRSQEDVRLVVHRRVEIAGKVVDPGGQPVAGAEVVAYPELASGTFVGWPPRTTTDSAGSFRLRLPARTTAAEITLLAPGFAVRQSRVDPRSREPLVLSVDQVGGTLIIVYPDRAEKDDPGAVVRRLLTTVFHDYMEPSDLANWAYLHGISQTDPGRFVIPLLEPGRYTACREADEPPPGAEVASALAGSCASGELSVYGELTLELPKPDVVKRAAGSAGCP